MEKSPGPGRNETLAVQSIPCSYTKLSLFSKKFSNEDFKVHYWPYESPVIISYCEPVKTRSVQCTGVSWSCVQISKISLAVFEDVVNKLSVILYCIKTIFHGVRGMC
jgi:hypothetical protein